MAKKAEAPKKEEAKIKVIRPFFRFRGVKYSTKEAIKDPEILAVLLETQWTGIEKV